MSLPSGYTQLEYIESTGTQYIDTGVVPDINTKVECDFLAKGLDCGVFGARIDYNSNAFTLFWSTTNAAAIEIGNAFFSIGAKAVTNKRCVAEMSATSFKLDGETLQTYSQTAISPGVPIYIFWSSGAEFSKLPGRVYRFKIYSGTTTIRDFIPCKNASGVVGLWDDTNSKFYANAGTGAFKAPGQKTKLGDLDAGSIVKLNVNGAGKEFIVVHQGKPSSLYDDSCDGTWLLMKEVYENRAWHSSNSNSYKASTIHSYLNSTFLDLFDSNIQEAIKQVKIPCANGTGNSAVDSGANGLSAKIFLLSGYEMGWTQSDRSYFPIDGACLSYFSGTSATDSKRIAYLNGSAVGWWLRSPYTDSTGYALVVRNNGGHNRLSASGSYGIRPALVLPTTLSVSDDGTVSTNTPPVVVSNAGSSGVDLGEKKAKFNFTYTPSDDDGDVLSVVERLDGVAMKSRTGIASGTSLTFECASTDEGFQQILNGEHVITLEVSDGKETTTFIANFSKAVHEASITMETAMAVEGTISAAIAAVICSIPDDAEYKVEVTNNANDASPVWQDVTAEVKEGSNIVFANEVAANGAAFNFRITAKRGTSGVGGYISAVSGAFQ